MLKAQSASWGVITGGKELDDLNIIVRAYKDKHAHKGPSDPVVFHQHCEVSEAEEGKKQKKAKFRKRVVCVSRFRLWLVHEEKQSVVLSLPLLHLEDLKLQGSRATLRFEPHGKQKTSLIYDINTRADASPFVQQLWSHYRTITQGWPDDNEAMEVDSSRAAGFSACYEAYCDLLNVASTPSLITAVESAAYRGRDLDFALIPAGDPKSEVAWDAPAVAWALRFNAHFEGLVLRDDHIDARDACLIITRALASTRRLTRVCWKGGSQERIPHPTAAAIGLGLTWNRFHRIQILQLSGARLSSPLARSLAEALRSWTHVLRVLDLSGSALGAADAHEVLAALASNAAVGNGLEELGLAGNQITGEAFKTLWVWFQSSRMNSHLQRLSLANCQLDFGPILLELAFLKHLRWIDVSDNSSEPLYHDALINFASNAPSLETIRLAHTQLPLSTLQHLVQSMLGNSRVKHLDLDLSRNSIGPAGAHDLAKIFSAASASTVLRSLDISDNDLREGLVPLLGSLPSSIERLTIDGNPLSGTTMAEALASMSQTRQALSFLSLSRCGPLDLRPLFTSLCTLPLRELNLSENSLGDGQIASFAFSLFAAPQLALNIDGNGCSYQGLLAIREMLRRNSNLRALRFPDMDLSHSGDHRFMRLAIEIQSVLEARGGHKWSSSPFLFDLDWATPSAAPGALTDLSATPPLAADALLSPRSSSNKKQKGTVVVDSRRASIRIPDSAPHQSPRERELVTEIAEADEPVETSPVPPPPSDVPPPRAPGDVPPPHPPSDVPLPRAPGDTPPPLPPGDLPPSRPAVDGSMPPGDAPPPLAPGKDKEDLKPQAGGWRSSSVADPVAASKRPLMVGSNRGAGPQLGRRRASVSVVAPKNDEAEKPPTPQEPKPELPQLASDQPPQSASASLSEASLDSSSVSDDESSSAGSDADSS